VLEGFGLLLVSLRGHERCAKSRKPNNKCSHLFLGIGERTPLLAKLGGDVLDGDAWVGLLDLRRRLGALREERSGADKCGPGVKLTASRFSPAKIK
jgi:hypothetical protein